jgi:hypothetical protein
VKFATKWMRNRIGMSASDPVDGSSTGVSVRLPRLRFCAAAGYSGVFPCAAGRFLPLAGATGSSWA